MLHAQMEIIRRADIVACVDVGAGFWSDPRTLEVLARRDIAALFRAVQRSTGLTQTRLGMLVGLSQAQVSEIVSGGRKVTSVDVLARIVKGLGLPDPALTALFLGDPHAATRSDPQASDVVTFYPMRGLISRPMWNDSIRPARTDLWLYGMAELGFALDDEVPEIFKDASARGCEIKVLLLNPDCAAVATIDSEEGSPSGTLAARIRSALSRFTAMRQRARVAVRTYDAAPSVSIVRCDSRMIVTPYMRFFIGSNSPSFELQRSNGTMFDRYVKHFELTWKEAIEWT
jgi:transcriptional regulator with XRE-family HTH domain